LSLFGLKQEESFIETLAVRERYRDEYWQKRDPIVDERLLWRAQSFRHKVHLLPTQTILELGCGRGRFTRQLLKVSKGENPLTCVTFDCQRSSPDMLPTDVEYLVASSFSKALAGRQFDFIVAMDLLDRGNCAWMLQNMYDLLKPGGQALFYESNPWNLLLKARRVVSRWFGARDPRHLLSRPELYELISEIGFIRVSAIYNDFVYRPIPRVLMWLVRNLSILLENAPAIRTLAGSILVHCQKPPRTTELPNVSLFRHESLREAVSVIIPCHNEEMNIEPLVRRLYALFGGYLHEIVLVDDNSADGTRAIVERLAAEDARIKPVFRRPPNGVGLAIRDGYRVATGRYVLSMDCDFQHLLPEVRDLLDAAAIYDYDMVVGSRFSRHSVLLNYPFRKIAANRGFHLLARIMLLRGFRDLTNNLKLLKREVVERLVLTQPGFAINAETGLQPLIMGYTVKEVPISWINRTPDMGSSSFQLARAGGAYFRVLINLWLASVLGVGPYKGLTKQGDSRNSWRGDRMAPPKLPVAR
jgi:dolichol-phosphate mannosyltransferase